MNLHEFPAVADIRRGVKQRGRESFMLPRASSTAKSVLSG